MCVFFHSLFKLVCDCLVCLCAPLFIALTIGFGYRVHTHDEHKLSTSLCFVVCVLCVLCIISSERQVEKVILITIRAPRTANGIEGTQYTQLRV